MASATRFFPLEAEVDDCPMTTATIASEMGAPIDEDLRTAATTASQLEDSMDDPQLLAIARAQVEASYHQSDLEAPNVPSDLEAPDAQSDQATIWAKRLRDQLSTITAYRGSNSQSQLPYPRIDESIMHAPRRRSADPKAAALANQIALQLYPSHNNPLGAIIQYEKDLNSLRSLVNDQRKRIISENTKRNESTSWDKRILQQGAWNPSTDPWSLTGAPSLPMPVKVAKQESLVPFFEHLTLGGTEAKSSTARAAVDAIEIEEPYYNVKSLEFEKGVLYSDRRMDLCKMVLGPTSIEDLMKSLKTNKFVKHFLLGNNIIGPHGAKCIAEFLKEFPDRMDTWYLAGNCIDTDSLQLLVDGWVKSASVTNIWLKRNPLKAASANDLFRLITQTPNLRTLDLDQTELGDAGVATLFTKLARYTPKDPLPLRHIYLNAVGVGVKGATAIAEFLASPDCALDAIYASNNPLGNDGVIALAAGLKHNKSLTRLTLASVGMNDDGAIALCESLCEHPCMATLDIGQHFNTPDLGSRYNWITDRSANAIHNFIKSSPTLAYLSLDRCALTHEGLNTILAVVMGSPTLLYYFAKTIYPQDKAAAAIAAGQEHARLSKLAHATLVANVKRVYNVDYEKFSADYKRWLVNDKVDVRKIDSVYRNRDAGMARRGLKQLDKWWDEQDETLKEVMKGAVAASA